MQRFIRAKPTLLEEFIALANADSSAIAKFVGHWGVLGLCRHNLPIGHPVLSEYLSISGWKAHSRFGEVVPDASIDEADRFGEFTACAPREDADGWRSEPLDAWRFYSRTSADLVKQAAGTQVERLMSMSALSDWLMLAPLRVKLVSKGTKRLQADIGLEPAHRYSALSSMLAVRTLVAALKGTGLLVCSSCGRVYLPRRKPAEGRDSYCPSCGIKAAWRAASARYYEEKKHGQKTRKK